MGGKDEQKNHVEDYRIDDDICVDEAIFLTEWMALTQKLTRKKARL